MRFAVRTGVEAQTVLVQDALGEGIAMVEASFEMSHYRGRWRRFCVFTLLVAGGCGDDLVIECQAPPVGMDAGGPVPGSMDGGPSDAAAIDASKPDPALDAAHDNAGSDASASDSSVFDAASDSRVVDAASDSGFDDSQLPPYYCMSALSPPSGGNNILKRGGCACQSTVANSHGYCNAGNFSYYCHDNRWTHDNAGALGNCKPFPRDGSGDLAMECASAGGTLSSSDCPQGFQSLHGLKILRQDAGSTDVSSVCCYPIQDLTANCVRLGYVAEPAINTSGDPLAAVCKNGAAPLAYLTDSAASICCEKP